MNAPLLEVTDLKTHFTTRRGVVKAVDGVSFSVARGETLGIVGESGSGKSMTALSIMRLVAERGGRIVGGSIRFDGMDLVGMDERGLRRLRGKRIAIILQEPLTALDPLFTIGDQLAEPMRTHLRIAGREIWRCVEEGLARVGIATPAARRRQYPHQMSGGMLQRIVGAIALSCAPELVIADEPTTSLDVTIQAQYLTLLKQLKREFGLALILVSHDLSVIAAMCERVAVMYAGRVVETATTRELFDSPRHPYTIALLRSLPRLDVRLDRLPSIAGQPPDLAELREGCAFAPRCADAMEICRRRRPPTVSLNGRTTECWLHAAQG